MSAYRFRDTLEQLELSCVNVIDLYCCGSSLEGNVFVFQEGIPLHARSWKEDNFS